MANPETIEKPAKLPEANGDFYLLANTLSAEDNALRLKVRSFMEAEVQPIKSLAAELSADGVGLLGVGDMGIGNTTASSAITAVLTGQAPDAVTGRGTVRRPGDGRQQALPGDRTHLHGLDGARHHRTDRGRGQAQDCRAPRPQPPECSEWTRRL